MHHFSKGAVAFQQNGAPASVPIFLAGVHCCGFEASLAECSNRSSIGVSSCTHSSDLNVQCSTAGSGSFQCNFTLSTLQLVKICKEIIIAVGSLAN